MGRSVHRLNGETARDKRERQVDGGKPLEFSALRSRSGNTSGERFLSFCHFLSPVTSSVLLRCCFLDGLNHPVPLAPRERRPRRPPVLIRAEVDGGKPFEFWQAAIRFPLVCPHTNGFSIRAEPAAF